MRFLDCVDTRNGNAAATEQGKKILRAVFGEGL